MARVDRRSEYRGLVEERDASKLELHNLERSLSTFDTGGTRLLRSRVRVAAAELALAEGQTGFIRTNPLIEELRGTLAQHLTLARDAYKAVEATVPQAPTDSLNVSEYIAALEAIDIATKEAAPVQQAIAEKLGRAQTAIRARMGALAAEFKASGLPVFGGASIGLDSRFPAPADAHPIPWTARECDARLARIASTRKPLPCNGLSPAENQYQNALAELDAHLAKEALERAEREYEQAGGELPSRRERRNPANDLARIASNSVEAAVERFRMV